MKSAPVAQSERIVSLDIIRGFALLGIFLVNMPAYHSPDFLMQLYGISKAYTGLDYLFNLFFQLFIQMKFYTIFSFLFGLGFYIFMNRAEQKGLQIKRLFIRRIAALLLFGSIHLIFLWFGDILHTYALAGMLLLFFYKRKTKTLLAWAFSLLFVIHLLMSLPLILPSSVLEEMQAESVQTYSNELPVYIDVYEHAPYLQWVSYRWQTEIIPILLNLPLTIIPVLSMFLFGLYAGKLGLFQPDTPHLRFIKKTWLVSLLLSIPFVALLAGLKLNMLHEGIRQESAVRLFTSLSGVTLCFFYLSSLRLLMQEERWQQRLRPLGYVGQMALTNYLAQTMICMLLFVGLGFYGKVGLAAGTMICFIIYIVQVLFSYVWLRKYRFGPLEWLWRSFTYGHIQPMKQRKENSPSK